jgi:hypothetical protein
MGRQICFYMLDADELEFMQLIKDWGDSFIDITGNNSISKEYYEKKKALYIVSPQSKIIKNTFGFVDDYNSDVIEFMRCELSLAPNKLDYGRLWMDPRCYIDTEGSAVVILKGKWFQDKYNAYKKWIIKNYRISKNKHYYIAKEAYQAYKEKGFKMMAGGPIVEAEFD